MTWHSDAVGELGCVKVQSVVQRTAQLNRSAPAFPGRVDWPSAPGLFCYSCCQGHCPEAAPQSGPCSAASHAAKPSPYIALSSLAGTPQISCGFVFAVRHAHSRLELYKRLMLDAYSAACPLSKLFESMKTQIKRIRCDVQRWCASNIMTCHVCFRPQKHLWCIPQAVKTSCQMICRL